MDLLSLFKNYLFSQEDKPTKVTVKNYLSDVNHFVRWYESTFAKTFAPKEVSGLTLSDYRASCGQVFSSSSLDRHFSSLRKFFKFLLLEGVISLDPFSLKKLNLEAAKDPLHLKDFKDYLYVYNSSRLTIKNYLIDIKQFLAWTAAVTASTNVLAEINSKLVEEYKQRLVEQGTFSPATINRKLSSLRKYLAWASDKGLIENTAIATGNLATAQTEQLVNDAVEQPIVAQPQARLEQPAVKSYSAFPPFRVAQKVSEVIIFALDNSLILHLVKLVDSLEYALWKGKGQPVFKQVSGISYKVSSTKKTLNTKYNLLNTMKILNIPKSSYAPLEISTKYLPWYKKAWITARYSRPKWYKTYRSYPIAQYLNFAVLIIFLMVIGFGFYNTFFQKESPTLAVAGTPVAPPRILSFQGRLTDQFDTPISTPSALRFAIYDAQTPASSAADLLWQEEDQVSPDQDGIFNILLGNTLAACGNALIPATGACQIPQALFATESALFLGVTVGNTPELTPRQQLATVAYATNAETLQGMVPTTSGPSAYTNTVLALDGTTTSPTLTIGGAVGATFKATGGQFQILGTPLLLGTTLNSGGNVAIVPDGLGFIDLQRPIINSTNNGNLIGGLGAVEVDDRFAVLATSSGAGVILNQNGAGDIFTASAGGVPKFTITYNGGIALGGSVSDTSHCIIGGATAAWGACGSGGANYWNLVSGTGGGYITPINSTADLLIGGQSTASASFAVLGLATNSISGVGGHQTTASVSGNFVIMPNNGFGGLVGIGTTTPATTLDIRGVLGTTTIASISGQLIVMPNGGWGGQVGIGYINPGAALAVNGNVGIGTAGPLATLDVRGNSGTLAVASVSGTTSFAALVANNNGVGDLFTASASGWTRFRIDNTGALTSAAYTNAGGVLYTSTTGLIGQTGIGTSGQCLTGGTTPTWNSCAAAANNFWQRNAGALSPLYGSDDLLLGSNSTTSAKIAFTGMMGNNPQASFSGNLIVMPWTNGTNENGGNVGIGTTSPLATLSVAGTAMFQSPVASAAAFEIMNTNGAPVFLVDTTNSTNLLTNPGFETGLSGWSLRNTSTLTWNKNKNFLYHGQASLKIATSTSANSGASTNAFVGGAPGINTYTLSFYAMIQSGSLTTLNAGYNQGSGDVNCGLNNNIVKTNGFQRYSCTFTTTNTLSSVFIDQGTGTTALNLYIDAVQLQANTSATPYQIGSIQLRGIINSPVAIQPLSDSTTVFQVQNAAGTDNLFIADSLDNAIGIGTNSPLATLDVRGLSGTTAVASVSGNTTYAALVANNNGVGDLFTASASGWTRFTVRQNGTLTSAAYTNVGGVLYTSSIAGGVGVLGQTGVGTSAQCLIGGAAPSWSSCASAASNFWQRNAGALSPLTSSDDLLIGNSSTASAIFAFTGLMGNKTQASFSGQLIVMPNNGYSGRVGIGTTTPATTLDIRGVLGTTTIASISGQLIVMPNGGWGGQVGIGYINPGAALAVNGNVGIGTTSPLATLDVQGTSGTTAVASMSGSTSFASLVANNNGVGDLFTASASGWTRFTITNAGGIALGGSVGTGANCLLGGTTATWGTCPGGTNYWQRNNGALMPLNITDDFLLGANVNGTASAQFSVSGIAKNQAVASLSGNLVVMPNNGWGGNVAIGKTTALANLDIKDDNSLAVVGAELVTDAGESNFTGSISDWSAGSPPWAFNLPNNPNAAAKDAPGTQALSLSSGAGSTLVANTTYQIKFDFTTTASSSGVLTPSIGGVNGVIIARNPNLISSNQVQVITTNSTTPLTFTPTMNWYGTITNVSIKQIATSSIALRLEASNGTNSPIEFRTGGSGSFSVFIGQNAGIANTGSQNTGVGGLALASNTTGNYNSAFGMSALRNNTTGYQNSAFGNTALTSNTTGYNNNAFGYSALIFNTTGNYNSAFGTQALYSNTTGYDNDAFGSQALYNNTTGYANDAFGKQALINNTTGSNNIAIGQYAMQTNTTGGSNIAIGAGALNANTTGGSNTALGTSALTANTTGGNNTAVGYSALLKNTTGSQNTAVGYTSLNYNTTAINNSALGYQSLFYNTTGQGNTAVGNQAIQSNTTGSNNTALGYAADFGYYPGSGITGAAVSGSNLNVGAYYYKVTFVFSDGKESAMSNPNTATNTTSGNQTVHLTNVPTYSGPLTVTARKIYRTKTADTGNQFTKPYYLLTTINDNTTTTLSPDDTTADGSLGAVNTGPSYSILLGYNAQAYGANQMVIGDNSGNGYINQIYLGSGIVAAAPQNVKLNATGGSGTNIAGANLTFAGGMGTGTGAGGQIQFQTATPGTSGTLLNALTTRMLIDTNGNVGIGTAGPLATLDVRGNSGTLAVASVSGTTSFAALVANNNGVGDLFTASASGWTRFRIDNSGNLLPGANLAQNIGSPTLQWNNIYAGNVFAVSNSTIQGFWQRNSGALSPTNITDDLLIGATSTTSATFAFTGLATNSLSGVGGHQTTASVSGNFIVMPNNGYGGNVGIGTLTPNAKLAVEGVTGGDVATYVQANKLIVANDSTFSGVGDWTTSGTPPWSVNIASSGVAAKDAPGTGIFTLTNNLTDFDTLIASGNTYQVAFAYTTTATSSGSLTPSIGSASGQAIGQAINMNQTETQVIKATGVGDLIFTPTSGWYGTIDNIIVRQINTVNPLATILNSNGTTAIELRSGGSGLKNTFIGLSAGQNNTTGNYNSFLGYGAGQANTSGYSNSFVGYGAGTSNTTGFGNSFLGITAGYSNTTGYINSFLGTNAGQNNTTGYYNSFIGASAGYSNTTGNYNSFVGYGAGQNNTTGFQNSFLGASAGYSNTTGYYNSFIGYSAGLFNTTGYYNSFLGANAGYYNTLGTNNAALGYQAGLTNTVGGLNTLLGYEADVGFGNLINAGAIGANAYVTQNNSLVLGSISGVNGATASAMIGIGTTGPTQKLHIANAGDVAIRLQNTTANNSVYIGNSGSRIYLGSDQGTTGRKFSIDVAAPDDSMFIDSSGRVGIGTTAPTTKLQVGGTLGTSVIASISGNLIVMPNGGWGGNVGIGTTSPNSYLAGTSGISIYNATYPALAWANSGKYWLSYMVGNDLRLYEGGASLDRVTFQAGGNVGIGTTSPTSPFQVAGTYNSGSSNNIGVSLNHILWSSGANGLNQTELSVTPTFNTTGSNVANAYGINIAPTLTGVYTLTNGYGLSVNAPTVTSGTLTNSYAAIFNGGNVGIGTTSPDTRLQVQGAGTYGIARFTTSDYVNGSVGSGLLINTGATTGNTYTSLSAYSGGFSAWNNLVLQSGGGNVGIGGTAPASKLSVGGNGYSNTTLSVNTGGAGSSTYGFQIVNTNSANTLWVRDDGAGYLAAASWSYGSDRRLKENITSISGSGLDTILQLNPVKFDYINGQKNQLGFIAQDVQQVIPEAVNVADPKTGYLGLETDFIIPYLVKAIQEQQGEIASLSGSLANLVPVAMTDTGDLSLNDQNASDTGFTVPHYFTLNDALGNPLQRVGEFSDAAIANLKVGLVNAQQITTNALSVATDNVTIGGQSLKSYIASVVSDVMLNTKYLIPNTDIVSPIASVDEIHTNFISPVDTTAQIGLKLDNNKLSILNTNNSSGSAVATIDNLGNASFSGQLTSNSLNTNDATVSGTLHVGKIIADEIVGASTSATYVTNVTNIYSTPSGISNFQFPISNASGSGSSNFGLIANAATPNTNYNIQDTGTYADISSYSGQLAYVDNLAAGNAAFSQNLTVFGQTSLSDTSVIGQLSVSGSLILADNSINVLGSDLNLQPLRQGGLSIMGGLVYIDTDGNLKVGGNAEFAKNVTVKGTLSTNIISPLPGNDLSLNTGHSNLIVTNASNAAVLSVNPLGDLVASGAGTFAKLNLNLVQPALAVSPTEFTASGSAGTANVGNYQTQVTIDDPLVTAKSLIYITPTSNTNNQVLYLQKQVPGQSFTVGLQNPSATAIPFNWIIVN